MTSKTMTSDQNAIVFIYLEGLGYVPAGRIVYDAAKEVCMFRYGNKYLQRPEALPIDPVSLPLNLPGARYTKPGEGLFSALRDSAPDHWGRKILSLMAEKHTQTLNEFEFLTAGFTKNRVGGLAFGPDPNAGPQSMAKWFDSRAFSRGTADLNKIARVVELVDAAADDELEDLRESLPHDEFLRALAMSPSVGGARPKCLFSQNGTEFIVKFSKAEDHWNEPLIEHATMRLAEKCGLSVARTFVQPLDKGQCLFVERFDRTADGHPRHFISGYAQGDLKEDGDWKSYQHLAQEARRYGDKKAGGELFERMVFNMICSNIDDHPRNQAFFVHRNRVELTPAYDLVPTSWDFSEYRMALNCGKEGKLASLDNALSDVHPFGMNRAAARRSVENIITVCQGWREHYRSFGVSEKDIEQLERRFRLLN